MKSLGLSRTRLDSLGLDWRAFLAFGSSLSRPGKSLLTASPMDFELELSLLFCGPAPIGRLMSTNLTLQVLVVVVEQPLLSSTQSSMLETTELACMEEATFSLGCKRPFPSIDEAEGFVSIFKLLAWTVASKIASPFFFRGSLSLVAMLVTACCEGASACRSMLIISEELKEGQGCVATTFEGSATLRHAGSKVYFQKQPFEHILTRRWDGLYEHQ